MKIRVKLFGPVAEAAGADGLEIAVGHGASVGDVLDRVRTARPALAASLDSVAVALNRRYVPPSHPVADGDEVAIIPPVSGG